MLLVTWQCICTLYPTSQTFRAIVEEIFNMHQAGIVDALSKVGVRKREVDFYFENYSPQLVSDAKRDAHRAGKGRCDHRLNVCA